MSIAPGTRIGPYEVAGSLGAGGMGEVYRAIDRSLKRQVAIKVLPAALSADVDRLARLQREAEVLASLNHPNIAAIYGLEDDEGIKALVMELVEGPTLADRLAAGALRIEEALPIARQIVDALEAAHERGIVHRDLKPANIKVRDDGTVKVLDFGLAKAVEPAVALSPGTSRSPTITTPAMTQMGVILGTAAYMSPEQARGKSLDKRTDVWSFGCVLYEMLAGARAFDAEDVSLTLSKVLQSEPDFEVLPDSVPARVRRTVRLCLRKPLRERMPDMGAVRLSLDGAFDADDAQTHAASGTPPILRWAVPLAVAAAALLGGLLVWRVMPTSPPARPIVRFALPLSESVAPGGAGSGRHVIAMSPQGTHLVYWADDKLFLRAMNSLDEAKPINGTENAREPFFSADGQWIGFQKNGQLTRVSITGGAPVAIGEAENPWGVSWDADGIIRYGQGFQGIWQVPASGGKSSQLIHVEKGELAHGPQLLPGGEWVLYTFRPVDVDSWDDAQIVVQSLKTGERSVVIQRGRDARYVPTGHLVYGLRGVLLAVPFDVRERRGTGPAVSLIERVMDGDTRTGAMHFTVSDSGDLAYLSGGSGERRALMWAGPNGMETIGGAPLPFSEPNISPDGTRVAVDISSPDGADIHVFDLAQRGLTRVTSSPAQGRYPLWTPDSSRIVFYSEMDGGGLYARAAAGTGAVERLTSSSALQVPYSWTPDGGTLILEQRPRDQRRGDLYVLRINGPSSGTARPLVQTPNDERQPALSPDGRWLAYAESEVNQGASEVFVRPFPNVDDNRWRISTDGGFAPLWSPDGKRLFYLSRGRAMVVSVETNPTFRPGTPTEMFQLPPIYGSVFALVNRQWDIAPDGKRFVILGPDPAAGGTRSQMVFVLNWFDELRRLVPKM